MTVCHEEKPRQECGNEAETTGELCSLACFLRLLGVPAYMTQHHLPMGGTTHCEMHTPIKVINQENSQQILSQVN